MAVITLLEFPGLTQEQYERAGTSLASGPPEGILYHSCGPHEGGWRIVDIWESREAFDRFVDGIFLAAVRSVDGPEPSRREVVEAHHAGAVHRG